MRRRLSLERSRLGGGVRLLRGRSLECGGRSLKGEESSRNDGGVIGNCCS